MTAVKVRLLMRNGQESAEKCREVLRTGPPYPSPIGTLALLRPGTPGALQRCVALADPTARWPVGPATEIANLALRCKPSRSDWETDFYTSPVLAGAVLFDNSMPAVYKNPLP